MVIWRICGNEIGPDGNGAYYFTTKREAEQALREFIKDNGSDMAVTREPERIVIRDRADLVHALHDAMGYGCT